MTYSTSITYFDTAMALIEIDSVRILTDPVFDPAGSRYEHGPIHLHKTSESAVKASELGRIDAVLLSHDQHADNLDNAGREFIAEVPCVVTTPFSAARLNLRNAVGLDPWAQVKVKSPNGSEVLVTAVPARHGPAGTEEATGPVTGFVIERTDKNGQPIYFSGDTIPFSGTSEIAERYAPIGLALLNLGRVKLAPMGDLSFSLSAEEASSFAEELCAEWIVPMHFEGWQHFSEDRLAAASVFARSSIAERVKWLPKSTAASFQLSG